MVLFGVVFHAGATSSRTLTLPSDVDYYIHNNPSFSLIFSQDFLNPEKDFVYLHEKLTDYDDLYKQVFSGGLNEKPIYIFAGSRNQMTNASAFSIPFLRVVFFPSGVSAFSMATSSYIDTVISHEMAHIFQLGQISSKIRYLKMVFGNSGFILIPFPVFLHPNLALSLLFLEGHAVLSESLFAKGGRMFSGDARALVFSQIKNKFQNTRQFIKNYLVNITEGTFATKQPYVHGGYFFTSLLDFYDIKTINSIFKRHAEHFVIPLSFISVKDSFESLFQNSFESLAHYYIQKYLPLAVQQSVSQEKPLFQSRVCPPFNKADGEVFFLTSDLKNPPHLRSFLISTEQWIKRKKSFAIGKLFKIQDKYYVSTNAIISPVQRVYGLFSEGMYLKKTVSLKPSHFTSLWQEGQVSKVKPMAQSVWLKSQKVFDIRDGQVLSMFSGNNMRLFPLLLNGEFYDQAHSSALFGPDGGVYYFKQRGYYRVMYRNKAPLFQFLGFYGKLVEISADGAIYFIASSLYGSALFGWTPEEGIYRVSPSDTIIEAIKIGNSRFLVCEVGPEFYSYKIISKGKITEEPVLYKYPFRRALQSVSTLSDLSSIPHQGVSEDEAEGQSLKPEDQEYLQSLKEIGGDPEEKKLVPNSKLGERGHVASAQDVAHTAKKDISYSTYHSLWHIRFNGIELGLFRDPITEINGQINMSFRDPMEYNSLKLTVQKAFLFPNWTFKGHYLNQAWRLSWDLQYIYKQGYENFFGAQSYTYIHEISQGFAFPLFKAGYWQSSLAITNALSAVEFQKSLGRQNWYFITQPSWQMQYRKSYKRGFDFHRHFFLKTAFHYHLKIAESTPNLLFKARSHYKFHWGWDFYTKPFINYKTAVKPKTFPFRYFDSLNAFNDPKLDFSLRRRLFEQTNNYFSSGLRVEKFITTPLYFARYPLSIESLAPRVTGTYVQFLDNSSQDSHQITYKAFLEWTFGMSFLILFHHKIKVRLGVHAGFSHLVDPLMEPMLSKEDRGTKSLSAVSFGSSAGGRGLDGSWNDANSNWSFGLRLHSRF